MRKGGNSSASSDAAPHCKNRKDIRPQESKDAGNGGFKTGITKPGGGNKGNHKTPR